MQAVERAKSGTHPALGIVEQRTRRALDPRLSLARDERPPAIGAGATGSALGAKIAAALHGGSDVGENQLEHVVLLDRTPGDANRRNDDPLLNELGRAARHAPRRHPTDVGMVRANRGEATELPADVDRLDEGEVRK